MKQKSASRASSTSSSPWAAGVTTALAAGGISAIVTAILSSIVVGALIWYTVRRFMRPKGRLPPGPLGLPLVGVIPRLGKNPQIQLTEWGKKYGNVYSAYMGPNLTVVLNDYDAIKATYVDKGDIFSGRPDNFILRVLTRGYHGTCML